MRPFLTSAIVLALTAHALADHPLVPAAKVELERGLADLESKQYAAAITAFDTGYAIDPQPDFLYAKGQAQRMGGDCRGAIVSYNLFLKSDPPESQVALAHTNIRRCEHVLAASNSDGDAAPPAPPPEKPERVVVVQPWFADHPGLALTATAVVSLGLAAAFALAANGDANNTATAEDPDSWAANRDAWQKNRTIAGVALAVGCVSLVGAGVRFWWASRDHDVQITTGGTASAALVIGGRW